MGDARIVLMTLIDEKLLTPGPKKLYVSYYRKRVYADLLADGSIRFKAQVYTSPVPCALHMKRSLNPSLKTDASWSSMYSTASGESLKEIKDRLNIRKRGTNARSAHKEKKAFAAKERVAHAAAAPAKHEVVPKCTACRKEATAGVAECSACHRNTHWQCASPALEAAPLMPWFCDVCLTGQADRILEFLQLTRRVLVERMIELKEKEEDAKNKKAAAFTETSEEQVQEAREQQTASSTERGEEENGSSFEDDEKPSSEDENTEDAAAAKVDTPAVVSEQKTEDSLSEPTAEPTAASERKASEVSAGDAVDVAGKEASLEQKNAATDAFEETENIQEAIGPITDVTVAKEHETFSPINKENLLADESIDSEHKTAQTSSAEETLLALIDGLIAEVSSRNDRANLIANTTGAMLVHLEKTQLVQLVENGKREIFAATQPESEEDGEQDDKAEDDQYGTASCSNSEVGALIKIFDLRHQILSSQSQFERTTSTLVKRNEMHLRNAETKMMEVEESRTVETGAITNVIELINQYSSDLENCKQKNYYNEVLLESINHRRSFIRSTNINDRFIPSYRYSTKLMTTSSDQLLLTVLCEKLRDITKTVNEWTKMERHFAKMTSSLNESLSLISTKRKRTGVPVRLPSTPALFAKVKIPPSRRLIERQLANYQVNLNSIRRERAQMRKTLLAILKIAREEHLSEEIVRMTDMLYQKCRDLKAEEEEEQLRLKEEAEAVAKKSEEDAICDRQSTDDGEASARESEVIKQHLNRVNTAFDSISGSHTNSTAAVANNVTLSSEMKGISSLLGREDSDAKDPSYNAAETKSRADNDEDSEEDLEQASRAIADITSSVLPDISGGSGSRVDLLNSSLPTEKLGADASHVFTSPGQFIFRGERGSSNKRDTLAQEYAGQHQNQPALRPSGQSQQSYLDQALGVINKQQQQQQRLDQQRQLELEEQNHQLERQRQLEQQRLLEHQERERQEWERQERKRLEKQQRLERQHTEEQRQEQERREQHRREQQRFEQERYEEQLIEQQRIEEQRRLKEQHRLEQQRLEQRRVEKQQRLEQQQGLEQQKQRLEQQQRHGKQHQQEQQRKEKQRRQQKQQRLKLELQCRQQEQQRQEQERQFQHESPSLTQVVPPGSSHLQMLSQQQQHQLQQQQAALQQQQHSRQLQHSLYGDMPKEMLMPPGIGTSQHDIYAQQMGMDMHDIVRHQDSSHFEGNASGVLRPGPPYMTPNEVSRSAAQQPAPTASRTSFYGDDGHAGQLHSQAVFGSQTLSGQQRQLSDHHHMFTNELQQQQSDQPRSMGNQDFIIGRPYRGLNDNMQHPGMDQSDVNDVNMGDWGQG